MKTIVSTLYNRPGYTRQLLEALSQCDGIGEYTYWAFVDPSDQSGVKEQLEWARDAGFFKECHWVVNEQRIGIRLNMQQALEKVFAQRVIVLEDDCIPATDTLRYFEWALDEYEHDPEIFTVTGYHRPLMRSEDWARKNHNVARRRCYFHPWGWATWKDRLAKIGWALPGVSWDKYILGYMQHNELYEIYPAVPRVKNVGQKHHHNGWAWAGNWELPMACWQEYGENQCQI